MLIVGCNKQTVSGECVNFKIISTICGHAVLQIQDAAYFEKGEDGYIGPNNKVFDHVFYTEFSCRDQERLNKLARPSLIGYEFNAVFVNKNQTGNCVRCDAIVSPLPKTKLSIQICD